MKKIGLCACYDTKNYGSMLQVFATQIKVADLGYDYEIIRYRKKLNLDSIIRYLPRVLSSEYISSILTKRTMKREIAKHSEVANGITVRNAKFDEFMQNKFTKVSTYYCGYAELTEGAKNYDIVLVGSDQLWTPEGLRSNFYNLMFVPESIKKISYATSFGVSLIPPKYHKLARTFLNRIDALSVREIRASEIIQELTGRKAEVVADPTLLLTSDEWAQQIPRIKIMDKGYIFCYFLGANPEHRKIAYELKEKFGLTIVCIPHLDEFVEGDLKFGDIRLYNVGPAEFVNLIRDASYVCTDSFHGTVFSILHHKKFITFNRFSSGKNSRNSRIDSLCKLTNLEARRYEGDSSVIENEIDYAEVDKRLADLRNMSMEFLRKVLAEE